MSLKLVLVLLAMALLAAGCGTVATTPGGSVVIQQGPDLSWLAALGISVHGTNAW